MLVSVATGPELGQAGESLRAALTTALAPWAARRHHEAKLVAAKDVGSKAVAAANADLSVALEIRAFTVDEARGIPVARAKVRVRIADPSSVVFDRVIVTDSVLGDKGIAPTTLAARVAREVLSIADPHVK